MHDDRKKPSLLLVDDSESLTRILSLVLSRKGFEIEATLDAHAAIARIAERPFDLVLMDIRMPGLDGVEAFRRMQMLRPGLRVLLMTAYAVDDLVQEALALGALGILHKPIDLEATIGLLERELDGRALLAVLVVDDHVDFCTVLKRILTRQGCEVLVAHNGEDAIEQARQRPLDLALVDLKLPTIDGFDTSLGIRRFSPSSTIVLMTGHSEEMAGRIREGLGSSQVFACLDKPLDLEKLFALLENLRGGRTVCEQPHE
jgi:two-component system, NtrC family, response regulator HydG